MDQCQGHVDETHPFYHYHLPKDRAFPFITACLMGCVDLNVWTFTNPVNPPFSIGSNCSDVADTQYDYSSVKGLYAAAIQNKTAVAPTYVFSEYVASSQQPANTQSAPLPSPPAHPSPRPSSSLPLSPPVQPSPRLSSSLPLSPPALPSSPKPSPSQVQRPSAKPSQKATPSPSVKSSLKPTPSRRMPPPSRGQQA